MSFSASSSSLALSLLLLGAAVTAAPFPQSLTEAQFTNNEQKQEEAPALESARQHRAVRIFSGYSNVRRNISSPYMVLVA